MNAFLLSIICFLSIVILTIVVFYNKLNVKYKQAILKYNNLYNNVNDKLKELNKPLRLGYYKESLKVQETGKPDISFEAIVYVDEIARYTNGECRIQINSIEPGISNTVINSSSVEQYIRNKFITLVKASDIEWLENESEIKELRRNKLEHLKEVLKNEDL